MKLILFACALSLLGLAAGSVHEVNLGMLRTFSPTRLAKAASYWAWHFKYEEELPVCALKPGCHWVPLPCGSIVAPGFSVLELPGAGCWRSLVPPPHAADIC